MVEGIWPWSPHGRGLKPKSKTRFKLIERHTHVEPGAGGGHDRMVLNIEPTVRSRVDGFDRDVVLGFEPTARWQHTVLNEVQADEAPGRNRLRLLHSDRRLRSGTR